MKQNDKAARLAKLIKIAQAVDMLQECGLAGTSKYIAKINPSPLSRGMVICRYKKLRKTIRKTPAISIISEELLISTRQLFRILKNYA